MNTPQSGILAPVPLHARYLEFVLVEGRDPRPGLKAIATHHHDDSWVVGFGPGVVENLGKTIKGLRPLPSFSGPNCEVPSTQADVWCWVRGSDRGQILHSAHSFAELLGSAFRSVRVVDGFKFERGLDLTGYEDGTENPEGEAAQDAALVNGQGPGLDGSSFVATQQWVHDLKHFKGLAQEDQDNIIGRRLSDNEELDTAPVSAHVKRTAQEDFDPEAFIVRRSMPWADGAGEGLMFVAFGNTLEAFEAQLKRMTGQDDGIVDGLFRFTHPISGSSFWCPPVKDSRLDVSILGL